MGKEKTFAEMLGLNFDIKDCKSLEAIAVKQLELADKEKSILEDYKDYDQILDPKVYNQIYDTIAAEFDNYRGILKKRSGAQLKTKTIQETLAIQKESADNQSIIRNKFEIRLSKFQNRLYKRECYVRFKMAKKREREASRARLAALRAENSDPVEKAQPP